MKRYVLPVAFSFSAAVLLAGCKSTTKIEAEDNHSFVPSARASVNLSKLDEKPSKPQPGHAMELGYSRMKGSDSQTVDAGNSPIVLGPTTFSAPQQLKNELDFTFTDISWRYRRILRNPRWLMEFQAGAGFAGLDLNVSSATAQASKHFSSWGPMGGAGIIFQVLPDTSIQARATAYFSFEDSVNRALAFEAYVVQALFDNVILRAGFAAWEIRGQALLLESDFRIRAFGPALNLELSF